MTFVARFVIFAGAACLAACSSVTRTPPAEAPKVASQAPAPVATPPREPTPRKESTPPTESTPPPAAQKAPAPPKSTSAPPSKPQAAPRVATAPKPAPAATAPKPPPAAEVVAPKAAPVAQAAAPKPAPLDLKTLEQRLKDTGAIGVLTKLSLKNQVDDLVDHFRAYHDGKRPPTLAELRPNFELLLMKVLSLLQDKDPALAHDVNASRDAIWSVLADKQKFAQFS